jgi:AraC-like DNA-binding protein
MMSTKQDVRPPRAKRPTHVAHQDLLVGPMSAIPSILAERGLDPALVLAEVGLAPGLFEHPENRMSYEALARLLETCVKRTSCLHFGLLIGQRFTMDSLGVLGSLMRNSPTLRDALRMATTHLELQDRGSISVAVDLGDSRSALGYTVFSGNLPAAVQILDGAIAIHFQILRQLCGPSWKPVLVQFSHSRPAKIAPFHNCFGPNVDFDARTSAIVFDSRWLDHPVVGADPTAYSAILKSIESMKSGQTASFAEQVRRAIYAMMFTASASSRNLARFFDVNERTLGRYLEREGVNVRELISEVRCELSQHLLRATDLSVIQISTLLHYSDATVFARAFRGWLAMSPTEWRKLHRSARRP